MQLQRNCKHDNFSKINSLFKTFPGIFNKYNNKFKSKPIKVLILIFTKNYVMHQFEIKNQTNVKNLQENVFYVKNQQKEHLHRYFEIYFECNVQKDNEKN
eukprot:TRINITY_DN15178_c0_g2_i9.p3 TRINITY_DN15178_c0_g2~~TRINITY_DN15178_c0_g2_i9.p3  ORF type:complete len:100 (+),score=0.80 TRINITY_DN15178_c0_g2_i9:370-669(+)